MKISVLQKIKLNPTTQEHRMSTLRRRYWLFVSASIKRGLIWLLKLQIDTEIA